MSPIIGMIASSIAKLGLGTTWFQSTPSTGMNRMKGVGWNGTVFVGNYENSTGAAYSSDGISWTNSTMASNAYYYPMQGVIGGNYVTGAYASNVTNYTANGTAWTAGTMPSSANWYVSCSNHLTGANARVMFSTRLETKIAITSNGSSWTEYSTLPSTYDWQGIGFSPTGGSGTWMVCESGGTHGAYSTNNGATWTSITMPATSAGSGWVAGNGSRWIVNGTGTTAYYSDNNGTSWTSITIPVVNSASAIGWNGKTWLIAAWDAALTSLDGITWTKRSFSPNINTGRDLTYGGANNNTWVLAEATASNPRNRYSTY